MRKFWRDLFWAFVITLVLILVLWVRNALSDEIYEKNGCVYIVGHLTTEEIATNKQSYKERCIKREIQADAEIERRHEKECLYILADAMAMQMIAEELHLQSLIKEGSGEPKINVRASGGHSYSYSESKSYGNNIKGGIGKGRGDNILINHSTNTNTVENTNN